MKKNGFVLVETVTVLIITVVAMLGLFKGYNLIFTNLKKKIYYDNVNDIYKVNIFKSMKETFGNSLQIFTKTNCTANGMNNDCESVMNQLEVDYLLFVPNIEQAEANNTLTNSDKEYLKSLTSDYKYLIMHYAKDSKNYYASLKVE